MWAKSLDEHGQWVPLSVHSSDTADIARRLIHWMPDTVLARVAAREHVSLGAVSDLTVFLAGIHDIGKATPTFQSMDPNTAALAVPPQWDCPPVDRNHRFHHTVTGWLVTRQWLSGHGCPRSLASSWAQVVGAHHGRLASASERMVRTDDAAIFGAHAGWSAYRDDLIAAHWVRSGLDHHHPTDLPSLSPASQTIVTAVVILADWISSAHCGSSCQHDPGRIDAAWASLNIPAPWTPSDQGFTGFSIDAPHESQQMMAAGADAVQCPSLMILEAPTGEGKTESALVAVEKLCATFGLGGFTVVLPTTATTDATYGRIATWLRATGSDHAAWLGHSRAALNADYRAPEHRWLRGNVKTAGLNPISVTTIDQALRIAVRAKHQPLAHLALAGKVVVLDEVHSYDDWTGSYLDTLLAWLGEHGVPVVLLSATLSATRRAELASSYAGRPVRPRAGGYPCLTVVDHEHVTSISCAPATRSITDLGVSVMGERDGDLVARVQNATAAGANVLVVRNTVARAMQAATLLRATGSEVTVAHSRFTAGDRARIDTDLLERFGAESTQRPRGHVVVGTQVVQQSLDIDFDLLITDMAPIDSLVQRAGRIHRHNRPRPRGYEHPMMVLTGVDVTGVVPSFPPGCSGVYGDFLLLRTMAALRGRDTLSMPRDIPELINDAEGGTWWPPGWESAGAHASAEDADRRAAKRSGAQAFLMSPPQATRSLEEMTTVDAGGSSAGAVRDITNAQRVVLAVRDASGDLVLAGDRATHMPTTYPGSRILRSVLSNTCQLPAHMWLPSAQDARPTGWSDIAALRDVGLLVLDEDVDGHHITYDQEGLHTRRTAKP